jgi:hypothetical protein
VNADDDFEAENITGGQESTQIGGEHTHQTQSQMQTSGEDIELSSVASTASN